MSWLPGAAPSGSIENCPQKIELEIVPRTADVGGFEVRRALPSRRRRMVGPFIFWDEMGPGELLSDQGIDVRPHPHIGLSTVTFLSRGSLVHRDSLGCAQEIAPGDVNLMTAGSGIVHSERSGVAARRDRSELAGIQSWLALPETHEEGSPRFEHVGEDRLPVVDTEGFTARVILGSAYGVSSPLEFPWPVLYVDAQLETGATLPIPRESEERALYILHGEAEIDGVPFGPHRMLVLRPGVDAAVRARKPLHLMLLGGSPLEGPRFIWWNFVSSSRDRIEQAKEDWRAGRFDPVPEDPERETLPE